MRPFGIWPALGLVLLFVVTSTGIARAANDGLFEPMTFKLGRLPETAECQAGCADFIVAEGIITPFSWVYLEMLLKELGEARPPLLINSPGGHALGSLSLARTVRQYNLTVFAAATRQNCKSAACRKQAADPKAILPYLVGRDDGICYSACPYVVAGGVNRVVAPRSVIGVHQGSLYVSTDLKNALNEALQLLKGRDLDEQLNDTLENWLRPHLEAMGVDKTLLDHAAKAKGNAIYPLSAEELSNTRLITSAPLTRAPDVKLMNALTKN
jgi:hypothetical protein